MVSKPKLLELIVLIVHLVSQVTVHLLAYIKDVYGKPTLSPGKKNIKMSLMETIFTFLTATPKQPSVHSFFAQKGKTGFLIWLKLILFQTPL